MSFPPPFCSNGRTQLLILFRFLFICMQGQWSKIRLGQNPNFNRIFFPGLPQRDIEIIKCISNIENWKDFVNCIKATCWLLGYDEYFSMKGFLSIKLTFNVSFGKERTVIMKIFLFVNYYWTFMKGKKMFCAFWDLLILAAEGALHLTVCFDWPINWLRIPW